MARALLPLAVNSSLLSYGSTVSGASIAAFGVSYFIFAIIWLYAVWRDYDCLWPMLPHFCHHMALRRLAQALLPLAWDNSFLLSCGCTRMARVLVSLAWVYLIFAIVWLYVRWREHYCLWPGLIHLCDHMAVPRKARVLLP